MSIGKKRHNFTYMQFLEAVTEDSYILLDFFCDDCQWTESDLPKELVDAQQKKAK
jgi:hypothetical protein